MTLADARLAQFAVSAVLTAALVVLVVCAPRRWPGATATAPMRLVTAGLAIGVVTSTVTAVVELRYYNHPVAEPLVLYFCHVGALAVTAAIAYLMATSHPAFLCDSARRGQAALATAAAANVVAIPLAAAAAFGLAHEFPDLRIDPSGGGLAYRAITGGIPTVTHLIMVVYLFRYCQTHAGQMHAATGLRSSAFAIAATALTFLHANLVVFSALGIIYEDQRDLMAAAERIAEVPVFAVAAFFALKAMLCGPGQCSADARARNFTTLADRARELEDRVLAFFRRPDRAREEALVATMLGLVTDDILAHSRGRALYAIVALAADERSPLSVADLREVLARLDEVLHHEPPESPARMITLSHPTLDVLRPAVEIAENAARGRPLPRSATAVHETAVAAAVAAAAHNGHIPSPPDLPHHALLALLLALARLDPCARANII